ncbi:hypothetical protein [Xanthocytophaga agilis]|uniref:Uncharacterized protein n=1 Tax=Xanthocytophaga agilis TaxID=3048010 RepID=A0AAE3RA39_9BACT|nr:hypothetical protein [Xanthocytophaga agilis]MDJ1504295.1 hypothetical protein [Xanthocytophaga agilis]
MKNILLLLTIALLLESCRYWPFVDYLVINDFEPTQYYDKGSLTRDTVVYLVNTDSLKLFTEAKVWIPNRKRSENLHTIRVDMYFRMAVNKYVDTIHLVSSLQKINLYTTDRIQLKPESFSYAGAKSTSTI